MERREATVPIRQTKPSLINLMTLNNSLRRPQDGGVPLITNGLRGNLPIYLGSTPYPQ